MTPAQLATLKAAILADPVLAAYPQGSDGAYAIAELLNAVASPEFIVWKTDVSMDEIMRNGMDWTQVDNLAVGKARIWEWIGRQGTFNAAKLNIRAGIDECWKGTAAMLAVRTAIYTHCKRPATGIEKIFVSGVGTSADPATMGYEGTINYQTVQAARES